jgi:hypothetical protein
MSKDSSKRLGARLTTCALHRVAGYVRYTGSGANALGTAQPMSDAACLLGRLRNFSHMQKSVRSLG